MITTVEKGKTMKIIMKLIDWESMGFVIRNFEPAKLTFPEIIHMEKIVDTIEQDPGFKDYTDKKLRFVKQGQNAITKYQDKFVALKAKYGMKPGDETIPKEVKDFIEESNKQIENEINIPMRILGDKEYEIEFDDIPYQSLRSAFPKAARFGEGGFSNSLEGKAAFLRAIKALDIDPLKISEEQNKDIPTPK